MVIVLTVSLTVKNLPPGLYQVLSIPTEIMDPDLTSLWHSIINSDQLRTSTEDLFKDICDPLLNALIKVNFVGSPRVGMDTA